MVVSVFVAAVSYGATAAAAEIGITAAVAEVVGSTIAADVITGAVIGTGTGALKAGLTGGDVLEGALIGGISAAVGAGVTHVVGQALGGTIEAGKGLTGATIADSQALGMGVAKGFGGAASGALGAGLSGGNPLFGALTGGLGSGLTAAATQGFGLSPMESRLLGGALSYGLGQAFAPDAPTRRATQATVGPTTYQQPTITGQAPTVSSTAPLGGALLASPTLGYTPGSTFLGGSDKDKPAQNVWNQASLKEGAPVGPNSDGTSQS